MNRAQGSAVAQGVPDSITGFSEVALPARPGCRPARAGGYRWLRARRILRLERVGVVLGQPGDLVEQVVPTES